MTLQVFDPYYNPIEVDAGAQLKAAQSLRSVYDSLRSDEHNTVHVFDSGTEDEKSEILVAAVSDDRSSNVSIVITEEGNQPNLNQCQVDNDADSDSNYPNSDSRSDLSIAAQPHSCGQSSTSFPLSKYGCTYACKDATRSDYQILDKAPTKSTSTNRSFSHSSSSSGYATETEASSPSPQILSQKKLGCTPETDTGIKTQTPHISSQTAVHRLPTAINSKHITYGERDYKLESAIQAHGQQFTKSKKPLCHKGYSIFTGRWKKESRISTNSGCSSISTDSGMEDVTNSGCSFISTDSGMEEVTNSGCSSIATGSGMEDVQLFFPTDNGVGKETCEYLQAISHNVLPECGLSLNPSHFEPLDSYI